MTAAGPGGKREHSPEIIAAAESLLLLARLRRKSRATHEGGAGLLAALVIENAKSRADVIRRRGKKQAR
jgi:hypothetical protein